MKTKLFGWLMVLSLLVGIPATSWAAFNDDFSIAVPTKSSPAKDIDEYIRYGAKRALQERLAIDHNFLDEGLTTSDTIGFHKWIHLMQQSTDPDTVANVGILYQKNVYASSAGDTIPTLYWRADADGAGTPIRMTAQSDMADYYINVKNYGAVGNGIHDDTAAIQAAIDAAGSDTGTSGKTPVFIPIGNYKTTAPITLRQHTRLLGAGRGLEGYADTGAVIVHTAATKGNVFKTGAPLAGAYTGDIEIGNLMITGNANTDTILFLDRVAYANIHDLTLVAGGCGIYIKYGMLNTFNRILTRNQTVAGVIIGTTNSTTTQTFRDCRFAVAPIGMDIKKTAIFTFLDNVCFESVTVGLNVWWIGNGSTVSIDNLYTENITGNAIRWGLDQGTGTDTPTDGSGRLMITNSFIKSTQAPYDGHYAIEIDGQISTGHSGLATCVLTNNIFTGWEYVLFADNTWPVWTGSNVVLTGNDWLNSGHFLGGYATELKYIYGTWSDRFSPQSLHTPGLFIGARGAQIKQLYWSTAVVGDGNQVTHNMGWDGYPTAVICTPTVSGQGVSVTAITSTTFTVAIKKLTDGSAGDTQTIYWMGLR